MDNGHYGRSPSQDAIDAKVAALYVKAEEYRQKGDYASEIEVLANALEMSPDNPSTLVKLGRAYRVLNFHAKAAEYYEKAIKIDPKCGSAYCNLGALCILSGKNQQAAWYYEKGLVLIDKSDTSDYATCLANYAWVIGRMGDKRKAAVFLSEAEKMGYANGKVIRDELELSAAWNDGGRGEQAARCSNCGAAINHFKFCPECGKKITLCPECGSDLPEGAAFCSVCGHELPRKCPKCGTTLPKRSKFCPECGQMLNCL